jgi:hypothetical protein
MRLPDWADSHVHDDDENLARVLITSWTLATGRTLRTDVPPHMLSTDELIGFWADAQMADRAVPADDAAPARSA